MAISFKDLNPGDIVYYSNVMPNSEYDNSACEIKKATFLRITSEDTPVFFNGKPGRVVKNEYWIREENGSERHLTLYDFEWHPGAALISDSLYKTGSYVYTTDNIALSNIINEAISKEMISLQRKIEKLQGQVNNLKEKYIVNTVGVKNP